MEIDSVSDLFNTEYLFFWGHTPPDGGRVNKSCLSQWFGASFVGVDDDILYLTAEHYMMATKASLFNDEIIFNEIISSHTPPKYVKELGRKISNYDDVEWNKHKFDIVV